MKHSKILLSAAFLLSSYITAVAATPMGQVAAGAGAANGPNGSRTIQSGSDVFEGDSINVEGAGNVQIVLDDGTKLVVGPSSKLLLKSYLRRNATTANKVGIRAIKGTFRFITGKSDKAAYDIQTSNATIGIRGTGFDATSLGGKTLVAVHEGTVKLKGRNGKSVIIAEGCEVGEAGSNKTQAKLLDGKPKKSALSRDLPFIINQPKLKKQFHLPVANCFPFLAENSGNFAPSTISPALTLPIIGGVVVGGAVLLNNNTETPISADGPPIEICSETSSTSGCD